MYSVFGILLEVATFLAVIIGLAITVGKEVIYPLWIKPEIKVIAVNDEDCVRGAKSGLGKSTRLRIRIENVGRAPAKNCYVKLVQILDKYDKKIGDFDPAHLPWVVYNIKKLDLARGEYHLVDLVMQSEGTDFIVPRASSLPNTLMDRIKELSMGIFSFKIFVYGDNFNPVEKTIKVEVRKNYEELKFKID